jgi:hypothetical protein
MDMRGVSIFVVRVPEAEFGECSIDVKIKLNCVANI